MVHHPGFLSARSVLVNLFHRLVIASHGMDCKGTLSRCWLSVMLAISCTFQVVRPAQAGEPEPYRPVKDLFHVETKRFILSYAIAPGGTTLAYCETPYREEENPTCELVKVELATGKELGRRRVDRTAGGVFSADGRRLAIGSHLHEGAVGSIWDVARWEPKVLLKCPDGHATGDPLAFSPDGKLVVGHAHPRKSVTPGIMNWYNLVLWDAATGECRVLEDEGAKFVLDGSGGSSCIVGRDGREKRARLREPLIGQMPMAINFSENGDTEMLFVEYHAGAEGHVFTTLWDAKKGRPIRTDWFGGLAGIDRKQYALAGRGEPLPGSVAELSRFRTTPSGYILRLPKYNPMPVIAIPYSDGSIVIAVTPYERDYGATIPYPERSFTELWRTEEYKNTTHRTCRLTADGRRLVAVGFDPQTARTNQAVSVLRVWDISALHPVATRKIHKLAGAECERLWDGLFKDYPDPDETLIGPRFSPFCLDYYALRAMFSLVAHPEDAVPWLRRKMGPPFDWKKVPGLIEDLNSPEFPAREQATRELERMGHAARPALERALANDSPAETRRRAQKLLDKLRDTTAAYELRQLRIIDVLEHIPTAPARELLKQIADGSYDPTFAEEAKRALQRATEKH